jgi:hypothetical protein
MRIKFGIAAFCIGLAAAACRQAESPRLLMATAEEMYLNQQYDEAIPVLKSVLLQEPRHAGAHFYLGTCYMNSPDNRWLMVALGEIQTGLAIFKATGGKSPIARFSDTYFELISHVNIAKVYLRQFIYVLDNGAPPGLSAGTVLDGLMDKCREQAEAARAVDPEAAEVAALDEQILSLERALRAAQRQPSFQRRGVL